MLTVNDFNINNYIIYYILYYKLFFYNNDYLFFLINNHNIIGSATTYYLVENENTSVPITGTSEGYLFYCATADTACKRIFEKGYYMNGGGSTFYCNGTAGNCKIETITAGTTCSATTVGKLALDNTDPVICLTSSISKKLSTDTGSYLVDYASNNIFSITTGKKGLVKIENNSVTLVTSGKLFLF